MTCRMEYSASYSDMELVHDALYSFNLKRTGRAFDANVKAKKLERSEALLLYGSGNNEFLGGIVWHWLEEPHKVFVDYAFVSDTLRGQGWGNKLFAEFENHVKAAGAEEVGLTTNSYQAPEFYLKLGYKLIGEKPTPHPLVPDNIHYSYCKKL